VASIAPIGHPALPGIAESRELRTVAVEDEKGPRFPLCDLPARKIKVVFICILYTLRTGVCRYME